VASFDGLRPILVASHCQIFHWQINFVRTFVYTAWTLYNRQQANFDMYYVAIPAYSRTGFSWALSCI